MDTYIETLNGVGDKILTWADPENQYRGPTEVSKNCVLISSSRTQKAFFELTSPYI